MSFVGKAAFESAILSPLIVPHFTIGLGVLMLFVRTNYAQSFIPVVACHVILVLPFVIRSVYISLHNLDGRLELAAASLGATPRKVLATITLPLLLPGIVGGWLFSAVLSFNEFTGTVFVVSRTTQTLPVTMYNYVREHTDPTVAAISTLYILATMILIVGAFMAFGPGGIHHCMGAHLARLEIKIAFEELLKRVATIEPAGEPERLRSNFFNGIKRLPVQVRS